MANSKLGKMQIRELGTVATVIVADSKSVPSKLKVQIERGYFLISANSDIKDNGKDLLCPIMTKENRWRSICLEEKPKHMRVTVCFTHTKYRFNVLAKSYDEILYKLVEAHLRYMGITLWRGWKSYADLSYSKGKKAKLLPLTSINGMNILMKALGIRDCVRDIAIWANKQK